MIMPAPMHPILYSFTRTFTFGSNPSAFAMHFLLLAALIVRRRFAQKWNSAREFGSQSTVTASPVQVMLRA